MMEDEFAVVTDVFEWVLKWISRDVFVGVTSRAGPRGRIEASITAGAVVRFRPVRRVWFDGISRTAVWTGIYRHAAVAR